MTVPQTPSLLGLPEYLEATKAQSLVTALTKTWTATMGKPPEDLDGDLAACRRWFDPVAQGQRLRRELAQLRQLSPDVSDPGPPLTLNVGPAKRLVTPEGRCALDLLTSLPDRSVHALTDAQLMPYDRLLAHLYAGWGRHRLQSVVDLLVGSTKPLQIPAAGVVIALLVNRCTSEARALTRFALGSTRDIVDRAFFGAVQAFTDVLAPRRRARRNDPHLVSGWMLYEAARRLGEGLIVQEARNGHDGKVWIRAEAEGDAIDVVARDLVRGNRAHATQERLGLAYDALVSALRKDLPKLAGFGLVHERPQHSRELRQRLLEALSRRIEAGA